MMSSIWGEEITGTFTRHLGTPLSDALILSYSRGEFEDPTVSNRHAKVHCLTFESDGGPPLPPLVYVIDLSSNGTYLIDVGQEEEQRLDKKSVPRLLFENDVLRLGGNTYCFLRFASEAVAVPQLTDIQVLESKACSNLGLPYRVRANRSSSSKLNMRYALR
jgi:hypothetical protein